MVDFVCGLHQMRADRPRGVSVQVVRYKAGRIEVLKEGLMVSVWESIPHKEIIHNDYCGKTRSG